MYIEEPEDKKAYTASIDKSYSRFARLYDLVIKVTPFWKRWISAVIPHIQGPKVLELSFGTGYLLTCYAHQFETYGIDLNWKMIAIATGKMRRAGTWAFIQQANVEHLPYRSQTFNTIVSTMAFTGYPDGNRAMSEIRRVLKPGGRLLLVDVNLPGDRNRIGMAITRFWARGGDIIRDMGQLFDRWGFLHTDEETGGFGTVHLYVATKG